MQTKEVNFDTIYTGDYKCHSEDDDTVTLSVEMIPESLTSPIVKSICNLDYDANTKSVNNIIVEEGEVCIVSRNKLNRYIDFEINDAGELIIHGKDADKYSISEDGELIYTES